MLLGHREATVNTEHKVLPLVCKPRIGWAWCPLPLGELAHTLLICLRPVDSRKREMSRDGKFQRRQNSLVQGFSIRGIFEARGHLEMSADICDCHNWSRRCWKSECNWNLMMCRTGPHNQDLSGLKWSVVPRLKTPAPMTSVSWIRQPRSYLGSTSCMILGGTPDLLSPISTYSTCWCLPFPGAVGDLGKSCFVKYQTTVKGQMSLQIVGR